MMLSPSARPGAACGGIRDVSRMDRSRVKFPPISARDTRPALQRLIRSVRLIPAAPERNEHGDALPVAPVVVTEQLDEGPVIMQDVFHINVGVDGLEDVKRKGLELEGIVLSRAVQLFLDEELVVVEGKVIFKPGISRFFTAEVKEK